MPPMYQSLLIRVPGRRYGCATALVPAARRAEGCWSRARPALATICPTDNSEFLCVLAPEEGWGALVCANWSLKTVTKNLPLHISSQF